MAPVHDPQLPADHACLIVHGSDKPGIVAAVSAMITVRPRLSTSDTGPAGASSGVQRNASPSISGAVFAGSAEEALGIARRMQVGAVSINGTGLGTAAIGEGDFHEKNAFKRSGLAGSRMGYDSITRFMRCSNSPRYLVPANRAPTSRE